MNNAAVTLAIDDPRWLRLALEHPAAAAYHHPAWARALAGAYGFRPFVLGVEEGDELVAGMPVMEVRGVLRGHRLISLPFSDHVPPLADPALLPALTAALEEARRALGCGRAEIHAAIDPTMGRASGDRVSGIWRGAPMYLHTTDLGSTDPHVLDGEGSLDGLFERLHRTRVRQPIERASEAGVEVRRGTEWEDVAAFYELHTATRRRLGTPVQPLRFFRMLWGEMLRPGLGFVALARHGGRDVAGGLFLRSRDVMSYKFGASSDQGRDIFANHLLLWQTMVWSWGAGCRIFDWGKTDMVHQSLRSFKLGWASREVETSATVLAGREPSIHPSATHEFVGRLIKRSPLWVCRALGRMLYRQFA